MFLLRSRNQHALVRCRRWRKIFNSEDIDKAQLAIKAFEIDYGATYPKAVAKIVEDADVLPEF